MSLYQMVNILKIVDQPLNIAVAGHVWQVENLVIVVYFVYAL